jgi:hypothetical protein
METEMKNNIQIYLTYRDGENLPYITAYIKKFVPEVKEEDIIYKQGNDLMPLYFIVEYYNKTIVGRTVIDLKLTGEITKECIYKLNHFADLLSMGNNVKTERIFLINSRYDTQDIQHNYKAICLGRILKFDNSIS